MKLTWILSVAFAFHVANGQNAETTMVPTPPSQSTGMSSATPSARPSSLSSMKTTLRPTTTAEGCYDNLDDVQAVIEDESLVFRQKDIILCPNTTFELGELSVGVIVNGQSPIGARSNTLVKCGQDGKRENGCIFKGGQFAILTSPFLFRSEPVVSNVVFQGLTLEGQWNFGLFLAKAGDVSLVDCIFKDAQNYFAARISYDKDNQIGQRRNLVGDPLAPAEMRDWRMESQELNQEQPVERSLQELPRLQVNFIGCDFVNLTHVPKREISTGGIVNIEAGSNDVMMENCTFSGNQFGGEAQALLGYAIIVQKGSSLAMKNVCMHDNDFRGSAAVVVEETQDFSFENVHVGDGDDDDGELDCPFAAYFANDLDVMDRVYDCIEPDASVCPLETHSRS